MERRDFLGSLISMPALLAVDNGSPVQAIQNRSNSWNIGTESVKRTFTQEPISGGVRLISLKNIATGYEWIKPSYCDFAFNSTALQFEGLKAGSGFSLKGQQSRRTEGGATEVRLDFLNQSLSLKLSLLYTSFPGTAVFEQRCRLENIGTKAISNVTRFDPVYFKLRTTSADLQVHAIRRSKYALERLPISEKLEIRGGGWNAPEHAGFIAVEDASTQEMLFVGIEWERDWSIRFESQDDGIVVSAGIVDISHDLKPGGVLESPRIFTGLIKGNLDDAARAKDEYLSRYVVPAKLKNFPWVVYDIWGTEKENVEKMILHELDFAAALGIEHLYIDASWYEGSSKRGTGDWGCGLGRYREDREKFPGGLRFIASRAHDKGMTFGLWVDPVVVDQRLVPEEIPHKWIGQKDRKDNVLTIPEWEAPVAHLCLGVPEVVEHLKSNLSRIVSEFKLDWLKWDNSGLPGMPVVCNREDHGHQKGDGSYAAQRGAYAIWEHLHKNHPDLVLEQCGYGSRHDFGLARYCRANWLSDATHPSSHVRENALTANYLYPSFYNGGWIVLDPEVQKQRDPALLDTIFRSRMIGLFGFGTLNGKLLTERISLFRPEVIEAARRNLPLYKRYRHLLAEDCYHLTPPPGSTEAWQAVEFCKRNGAEAVVLAFRSSSTQDRYRLKLKGLRPAVRYRLQWESQKTEMLRTGAELVKEGIVLVLPKVDMSDVLLLSQVS